MTEAHVGHLPYAPGPEAPAVPRRPQRRATEPGVQAACRRVLAALDGLEPGAQLRVLRAAALLLGADEPPASGP
jgi:hypothetical protein